MSYASKLKNICLVLCTLALTTIAITTANAQSLSEEKAATFMRTWLNMIDTNAAPSEYLKYLPEGDFEQWSYPNADIKNVDHLKSYFQKTWGMIKKNTNKITNIETEKLPGGRVQILTNVNWTALTADGKTLNRDLKYTVTVGEGQTAMDPKGQFVKVFRYKIRPATK
jgi:hypothetical protein